MPTHAHLLVADVVLTSSNSERMSASNSMAKEVNYGNSYSYRLRGYNGPAAQGLTSETGGDAAHTNLQPYIVMYHIIYTGITS